MNELEQSGITLVMVSIGTPANGNKLADHLAIPNLRDFLYLDPENALYDSLNLNKGLKSTIFSPATSFAFLRRFTTRGAMTELNEVLPKWSKGTFAENVVRSMNIIARTVPITMCRKLCCAGPHFVICLECWVVLRILES